MNKLIYVFFLLSTLSFSMEGIDIGSEAPNLKLKTIQGETLDLRISNKPLVLVFFRGSWCPYCINQLKSIKKDLFKKVKDKADLVAISVDRKKIAKKMKDKYNFDFHIVSDPKAKTLKAFNIVNKLDESLVKKYKAAYKIDVEADSGEKHHMVAHPAVFIIENSKIIFSDIQTDYKVRTDNSKILKALSAK